MSGRRRLLVVLVLLTLAGSLVAADRVVRSVATPTYLTCRGSHASVLVHGFGEDRAPVVERACEGAQRYDVSARMAAPGELELTSSTANLLAFDGRRGSRDVRVFAGSIDHGRDHWWVRALDLVTPFADLDQTIGYGGTEEAMMRHEVGLPRVQSGDAGESIVTVEVGTHAEDPSFSLLLTARSTSKR